MPDRPTVIACISCACSPLLDYPECAQQWRVAPRSAWVIHRAESRSVVSCVRGRARCIQSSPAAKAIHEEVDAGPGRTDHFRHRFLRDLRNERSGSPSKPKCHRQENSGQTLFAGVEELIDQIGLGSHTAREQNFRNRSITHTPRARRGPYRRLWPLRIRLRAGELRDLPHCGQYWNPGEGHASQLTVSAQW